MMKFGKRFGITIAVLLAIILIGLVTTYVARNALAKAAVERGCEYALGVRTSLQSVHLDLLGGHFRMGGLHVANPEGFATPTFLALEKARISVDVETLTDGQVDIPRLHLEGLDLNIEKREGLANYESILENLQRFDSGKESPSAPESAPRKVSTIALREIVIRDIRVSAALLPLGGALTRGEVLIDEIHLKNLGSGNGAGLSISDITAIVLKAVLSSTLRVGGKLLPDEIEGGLGVALGPVGDLSSLGIDVVAFTAGGSIDVAGTAAKELIKTGRDIGSALQKLSGEGGKQKQADSETE
jgi:hypothetical protein